jgi:hypothetical protein
MQIILRVFALAFQHPAGYGPKAMANARALGAVLGLWLACHLCCAPRPRGSAIGPARPTSSGVGSPGPDAAQTDFPDGTDVLAAAARSAWGEEKASPWIALLAPDAVIVTGRGPRPDPYDVHFARAAFEELLAYQFGGHAFNGRVPGVKLRHEAVRVKRDGETCLLELTRVVDYEECDEGGLFEERTRVRYALRRSGGAWQIAQMRWWPLSVHPCDPSARTFDADGLHKIDAKIASYSEDQPREKGQACFDALRYGESADWYDKAARSAKGEPRDWLLLGWSAAFAGQMERARGAFAEALRRDPTLPVPRAAGAER